MKTSEIIPDVSLHDIQKFLSAENIAIAGASRNPQKFGGTVVKELKNKGYNLFPVNPNAREIQGIKCFQSVTDLPDEVKHLIIVTPKSKTFTVAQQAIDKKMETIWIQQFSETPDSVDLIHKAGIKLIQKKCILMFAEPVEGPHKFHRFLFKLFGRYPKKQP